MINIEIALLLHHIASFPDILILIFKHYTTTIENQMSKFIRERARQVLVAKIETLCGSFWYSNIC